LLSQGRSDPLDFVHYPALSCTSAIVVQDSWPGKAVRAQAFVELAHVDVAATFSVALSHVGFTPSLASTCLWQDPRDVAVPLDGVAAASFAPAELGHIDGAVHDSS
jgi:hypothetical protein